MNTTVWKERLIALEENQRLHTDRSIVTIPPYINLKKALEKKANHSQHQVLSLTSRSTKTRKHGPNSTTAALIPTPCVTDGYQPGGCKQLQAATVRTNDLLATCAVESNIRFPRKAPKEATLH